MTTAEKRKLRARLTRAGWPDSPVPPKEQAQHVAAVVVKARERLRLTL